VPRPAPQAQAVRRLALFPGPFGSSNHGLVPAVSAGAAAAAAAVNHQEIPSASSLASAATAFTNLFPVWVLGAAVVGFLNPAAFAWFQKGWITPALGWTMLGMGLSLTFGDFKRVLKTPGRIFLGFALQYTVMPLLGYAVKHAPCMNAPCLVLHVVF
jgi:hypothetical protein